MAITEAVLESLAKSVDLRIEALNTPTSPGQPQDFQIRPASLLLSPSALTLSPLGGLIPTEASLTSAIPVELTVEWGVEDVAGNAVKPEEAILCSRPTGASATLDRTLQTTVMVLPDFVELVRDPTELPAKTRYVTASVTLTVKLPEPRTVQATVPLLRYPVTVPAIPVPTLAVFFAKPTLGVVTSSGELQDGDQFALIVVPESSPIGGITALRAAFDRLLEITGTANRLIALAGSVAGVLPALTELGTGLGDIGGLLRALDAHKVTGGRVGVAFVSADRIPNLNEVDTILDAHYFGPIAINDVEAEDTISSFVFVGPPGRKLRCFQNRGYKGEHLTVTTGNACLAIVHELENVPPHHVEPDHPLVKPTVEQHGNTELNNRFSAMAFL